MDQPGVTTRPITRYGKLLCETFFDDAKAPVKDLVGGLIWDGQLLKGCWNTKEL